MASSECIGCLFSLMSGGRRSPLLTYGDCPLHGDNGTERCPECRLLRIPCDCKEQSDGE